MSQVDRPRFSPKYIIASGVMTVAILAGCDRITQKPREENLEHFFTFTTQTLNEIAAVQGSRIDVEKGYGVAFGANGRTYWIQFAKDNPTLGGYRREITSNENVRILKYILYDDKIVEQELKPKSILSPNLALAERNLSRKEIAELEDKIGVTATAWKQLATNTPR